MSRSKKIFVPDEAKRPKANYPDRESANRVRREIRQWIRDGNMPFLWHGHTHTKPPPGSVPIYIMEVDLPERLVKAGEMSPCPCCTPESPKFGRGYVAWFEDESVIRIIGRHCFRRINPEYHDAAVERLKREKRREFDDTFLIQRLPEVPGHLREMYRAGKLAQILDHLRSLVRKRLEHHGIDLWPHIRRGVLFVGVEAVETWLDEEDTPRRRTVRVDRKLANVLGTAFFEPDAPLLVPVVQRAISELKRIEYIGPTKRNISQMSDGDVRRLANRTRKALRLAHDAVRQVKEVQSALDTTNLANLRRWGGHPDAPVAFFVSTEAGTLLIGERKSTAARIPLDPGAGIILNDINAPSPPRDDSDAGRRTESH